ncbi:hypothetical protein [Limnohabitans sp. T6-20]|uniref:hypothetical protein n=1 Tax=Limnohabitans sp. T6-20 TaxID=1100725 RepID=UPI0011B22B63|nr:hypothetical protein [Limnohabitans sp. T6-20]
MNMKEELEGIIPTKAAYLTLVMTFMLLPAGFYAPDFLQPLLLSGATAGEIVLVKLLLPTFIGLAGSLLSLIIVIRSLRAQAEAHKLALAALERKHREYVAILCKPKKVKTSKRI